MASNSNVNPLPSRAQGTLTRLTPQVPHLTRGTRAFRYASCWKKLRCRQDFSSVSWTGQPGAPQHGQANRAPLANAMSMSSRRIEATVRHRPRCPQPKRRLQQFGVTHTRSLQPARCQTMLDHAPGSTPPTTPCRQPVHRLLGSNAGLPGATPLNLCGQAAHPRQRGVGSSLRSTSAGKLQNTWPRIASSV